VIQAAHIQVEEEAAQHPPAQLRQFELKIPPQVPGSETPLVTLPRDPQERASALERMFPDLPPLPDEPRVLPGPGGIPYTLDELQRLAAANSPTLRQAASDVEAAHGNLQQAATYANPTIGYLAGPNNNNTATGTQGFFIDQVIRTGGKVTLQTAAARMDLKNAELALRRARFDLATQVRTAYYNFVVTRETVRVNRALAHYTDEIFRLQADLLAGDFAASHEPTALRAQAFSVRLNYIQAINSYLYAWKQLVAAVGLHQLPLSEVEGEVDRLIPYYDYDVVLAHVLANHTDVLTARSSIQKARYNLKSAQVTPVPDVDVRFEVWKENTILPLQNFHAINIGIPFPIWDQNRGNIRAATSALVRAGEGPHQVELALTQNLATAYSNYKNNLAAVEYYRRYILPDQVRYYRGVYERRRIDPGASFNDMVTAQQTLVGSISSYLGVLGQLWTSVVGVADLLQTNDMYQLARPIELPRVPDLESIQILPCPHPNLDIAPSGTFVTAPEPPGTAPASGPAATTAIDVWISRPLEAATDYFARKAAPKRSERIADDAHASTGFSRSTGDRPPIARSPAGTIVRRPENETPSADANPRRPT
jgi:cobalt-zinc-cadmium efflux system outer membrane protein